MYDSAVRWASTGLWSPIFKKIQNYYAVLGLTEIRNIKILGEVVLFKSKKQSFWKTRLMIEAVLFIHSPYYFDSNKGLFNFFSPTTYTPLVSPPLQNLTGRSMFLHP